MEITIYHVLGRKIKPMTKKKGTASSMFKLELMCINAYFCCGAYCFSPSRGRR